MGSMKVSDKKKYDKAWELYYEETGNLALALDTITQLPDKELRVEEVNSIATSIGKLAKSLRRTCEQHNMKVEELKF